MEHTTNIVLVFIINVLVRPVIIVTVVILYCIRQRKLPNMQSITEQMLRKALCSNDFETVDEYLDLSEINTPTRKLGCKSWGSTYWFKTHGRRYVHDFNISHWCYFGKHIPWTPLQHVCVSTEANTEFIIWLLERGANPNIRDRTGRNIIDMIENIPQKEPVVKLLEYVAFTRRFPLVQKTNKCQDINFYFN